MLLDLNKLHGAREHFERTFQPSAFDPAGRRIPGRGAGRADARRRETGRTTPSRVSGRARTELEVECGRCLEPFRCRSTRTFELRYVPQAENMRRRGARGRRRRLTTAFYRDGMLDLIELLREQFMLALPMKPLCAEACRGLCPQCGTNLNKTQCDCAPTWEDPRLAPLKGLLTRDKEN